MALFFETCRDLGQKLTDVIWNSLDDLDGGQDGFFPDISRAVAAALRLRVSTFSKSK